MTTENPNHTRNMKPTPGRTQSNTTSPGRIDSRWLTLQRTVAIAMIVANTIPMVLILQRFIPPLAIASALFAAALALTWQWPRTAAISIGVLSGFWLLSNFANLSQVIPDLTRPGATLFFMVTLAHIVAPANGTVGLIGAIRRAPGRIAERTLQTGTAVLAAGLAVSLIAKVAGG